MKKIGITGHREDTFDDKEFIKTKIFDYLDFLLLENKTQLIFNLGGANGIDNWVGEWCIKNNINYNLYLPFKDIQKQIKGWNTKQKKIFSKIRNNKNCLNIYYGRGYFDRNRKIVDNSDIILSLFFQKLNSGTSYTLNYAKKKGINIIFKYNQIELTD